jgi:hypothetical protein
MSHKSRILLIGCSDPRLRRWLNNYAEKLVDDSVKADQIDQIIEPGAIPGLANEISAGYQAALLQAIEILAGHEFDQVHLVTHEDCAAIDGSKVYDGPDKEAQAHFVLLEMAQNVIKDAFPGLNLEFKIIYVTKQEFQDLNQ